MQELLSPKNREYIEQAKAIAEQYVRPNAAEWDRNGEYPAAAIEALQKAGLMGVWIPPEYGGRGDGVLNLCLIVEQLSRACGGVGVTYAVNALGSFPVILGGTDEQKEHYLPQIARGEKLISFGLSETNAGSDPGGMQATAIREGDFYRLNGDKKWNTNGNAATIYTVFASTNPERGGRGVSAFLVEKGTKGFEIGKKEDLMGIRCVPVHELHFRDCMVSPDQLLGGREGIGFKHAMMTLDNARPGVAAQAVGLAQGALDLAVEYTGSRVQFGQAISANQGIQWMLADMATQVEAARQLVYASARALDMGLKASKLAAQAKVFATDTAMKVTTDAVQLFGGYGYCRDYPIEKFMRDAKITQIYEGTNQIQRLVIGRALLREAAEQGK